MLVQSDDKSIDLTVVATDQGGLNSSAEVKINLIDVNDNYPKMEQPLPEFPVILVSYLYSRVMNAIFIFFSNRII